MRTRNGYVPRTFGPPRDQLPDRNKSRFYHFYGAGKLRRGNNYFKGGGTKTRKLKAKRETRPMRNYRLDSILRNSKKRAYW